MGGAIMVFLTKLAHQNRAWRNRVDASATVKTIVIMKHILRVSAVYGVAWAKLSDMLTR
jgi:hypothetical protein